MTLFTARSERCSRTPPKRIRHEREVAHPGLAHPLNDGFAPGFVSDPGFDAAPEIVIDEYVEPVILKCLDILQDKRVDRLFIVMKDVEIIRKPFPVLVKDSPVGEVASFGPVRGHEFRGARLQLG